nr:NAD(P)-dependent oxidoreductase [Acidiferrimicrobium sp. IK]
MPAVHNSAGDTNVGGTNASGSDNNAGTGSDRPRALVTAPLRGPGLERLMQLADVVYEPWIEQSPLRMYDDTGLATRVAAEGARVLVVESDLVGPATLALPLIAVAATRGDPNNVDLEAATAAGIPVLHTPGRNADAVAEHALALLLAVTRRITDADGEVRAGEVWKDGTIPYQRYRAGELAGRRVALLGLGAVGRALRWRLEALGMQVRAYDPYQPDADHDLDAVVDGADVLSIHAPKGAGGAALVDRRVIERLAPGAVIINTARGSLLDTGALIDALRDGRLGGAGIDHVEGEAPGLGDPLLDAPNVVVTPHIAGATWDTESRGAEMIAADLALILDGRRPTHLANPEVLGR